MPAPTPAPGSTRGPADVTAVLVAHDGARWLPEALAALQALTVRPRAVVAVDTGSTDGSGDLLRAALGADAVLDLPRGTGYGAAVAAGLAHADSQQGTAPWLWLLHDDAAPAPDALAVLLEHARLHPSATLLGPKAVDWYDARVVVEVGVTTDRAGHRTTGLDRRERDQGQHDAPRDVLAVGTAGALVRRDTWDALGGLDPSLPLYRDELDLGWRVNAAGGRAVVVPRARVRHARAATTGRRSRGAARHRPVRQDREHAVLVLLAHASRRRLLAAVPVLVVATLLRALVLLLGRRLSDARDEVAAVGAVLLRPGRLRAMRRARTATRTTPPSELRPLLASRTGRARARVERLADRRGSGRAAAGGSPLGLLLSRTGVVLVLALALLALLAERSVLALGGGVLHGGRLLPPPAGASDLWQAWTASWSAVGVGTDAPAAPRTAVLAALSTLLLGKPWLAVDVLLLASVPLAGLTAYLAARRLVRSPLLRVWAAATWALLPVATGAVAAGRLDAAAVQVLLPLLGLAGHRVLAHDPRGSWHRVWATGLLLALAVALAPSLWLVVAPLALAAGLTAVAAAAPAQRPAARRRAGAALLAVALPVVLLLPWSLEVARTPALLLHGPGRLVQDPALADPALQAWALPLLHPGGAGLPPRWVTAGLLLAALAALAVRWRRRTAVTAWTAALAGLLVALVLSRLSAPAPASGVVVAVWPGVPLQVAAAGLLVAALVAGDGARARLARTSFGWRQVTAALLAAAAALVPLAAGLAWVVRGADEPLVRDRPLALPAFVPAELAAEPGLRVLALQPRPDGVVGYELTDGTAPVLGSADLAPRAGQREALDDVVADLLAARGSDAAASLATRGVRYVALPPDAGGAAAALDAQPLLVRRSDTPVLLWEVAAPTGRLTVVDDVDGRAPSGEVEVVEDGGVPAGDAGRLLVLASAADDGWRAELDGEPLEPTTAYGWAQAFVLPAGGGAVEVRHDDDRRAVVLAQVAGLVVAGVLAAPGGRRRRGLEPADDDRSTL